MTDDLPHYGLGRKILEGVLLYALWIIACGVGALLLLVGRSTYLVVFAALGAEYWASTFVDKILFVLAAVGLLALVVGTERYLQRGGSARRVLGRAARLVGIELCLLSMCHVCQSALAGLPLLHLGVFRVGLLEGAAGILLFLFSLAHRATRGTDPAT